MNATETLRQLASRQTVAVAKYGDDQAAVSNDRITKCSRTEQRRTAWTPQHCSSIAEQRQSSNRWRGGGTG